MRWWQRKYRITWSRGERKEKDRGQRSGYARLGGKCHAVATLAEAEEGS